MAADELVYTRALPGLRSLVFACLTEPENLAAFWGPAGTGTPVDGIVVELQAGSRFETVMIGVDDGSNYRKERFDEVNALHMLSWTDTDTDMATTVSFTVADSTQIRTQQRRAPEAYAAPLPRRVS